MKARFSILPILALLALLVTIGGHPAQATVMVPLSIEEMTKEADAVVRGRVIDQSASWDDKHERIYTTTTLEVLDPIHTPTKIGHRVSVRSLGGEVDGIGMAVAGTPKFLVAEEVLLFLRKDPIVGEAFQVIGMSQGRYKIEHENTGRAVAVPNLDGIALAKPDSGGVLKVDPNQTSPQRIPLDELRRRIVSIAAGRPTQSIAPSTTPPAQIPAKDPSTAPRTR